MKILALINTVGHTNMAYNEFILPKKDQYGFSICAFYPHEIKIDPLVASAHANGSVIKYLLLLRKKINRAPDCIVHVHSCQTGLMFLLATMATRPRMLRQTVMTVHNSYEVFKWRHRLFLLPCFLFFRYIICCGESSYHSFKGIYRRLTGRRLVHITNGVNIDRIDRVNAQPSRVDATGGKVKLLYVAAYRPVKNHMVLIKAFSAVFNKDVVLYLVGAGQDFSKIKAAIEDMPCKTNITLIEHLRRNEVFRLMQEADLFVSTSLGEGLPVSVLEAMACRCAVILSDIPSHRDISSGADFIPLIPAEDTQGYANAINQFLSAPKAKQDQIKESCRKQVEKNFSLAQMLDKYENLYESMLDDRYDH